MKRKKHISRLSFLLILVTVFNILALTACTAPDGECKCGECKCIEKAQDSTNPPGGSCGCSGCACGTGAPDTVPPAVTVEGIDNPEKYSDFEIPREKLEAALADALLKIDKGMADFGEEFPAATSTDDVYATRHNRSGWWQGFWTGTLWQAYEITGDEKYKTLAMKHVDSFYTRIDDKVGVNHHDMGFLYSLSCVAAYKLTGDERAKEAALMAADHLTTRYSEDAKFIQAWGTVGDTEEYRLIVDCLLNIPLLYWASDVSYDGYYDLVAYNHFLTTVDVCYREDGSTYHTYFFDPVTNKPLYGATAQGAGDETTWSRGQAWGIYGPMLSYKYTKDEKAIETFKLATNYYLNNLPADYVAYWDLSYNDGDFEPKDSSSAAIAVCGILEALKYMDEDDPYREIYKNAANRIMNSLIENYTSKDVPEANGLLLHGTYSMSAGAGIDEMSLWGDYFYLEALHRMLDPEWSPYW